MLDAMRMRTASFARAPQRYTSRLSKHFLLTFQEVKPLRKTRNQLSAMRGFDHRIGHLWPLSMTAEFSNAPTSRAEVRVPRTDAAGMADAMIDALVPILSGASVLGLPTLALASLLQT
jgi:hypothetical protein